MRLTQEEKLSKQKISFLIAEAQSEKYLARIRFTFASICALISLYLFAINKIDFTACSIQIGLIIFFCIYNGMFLFEPWKRPFPRILAFVSSFLDVLIVTVFIWTFYRTDMSPELIHITFFPAYFIIVGFTALHNQQTLPYFTGLLSLAAYCLCYWLVFLPVTQDQSRIFLLYIPGLVMLLVAAVLSALISRNNYKLIEKITLSEGRFSTLDSTLPLMLFRLNKKGEFVWVKTLSNKQFGKSPEKIIGHNLKDFFEDTDVFSFRESQVQGTFKVNNFSQDMLFVDLVIRPDTDKDDVFEGSMVDVTDRELAISQREEMEQRLFQYKKMESLGTLASGMAHDFNNILQTVTEISARIGSETSESKTKHGIDLIAETLTDARFLISELLALGRKKPLNYSPVNLTHFLQEIVPVYAEQLGDSYEVKLDVRHEKLLIQGDTDYLKRVFQNLFGNARDAMPEGGSILIEAFLTENEGGDKTIIIRFSDTGIGIPKDISEKIFDPFYTTKKKGKGTGLGLALVRRIVSLHKGVVFVEKSGPQGTTFRIEFPECGDNGNNVDTKAVLVNRLSTSILILDDDPKMCNILNFFLTDLSYKTYKSSTVEDGLGLLEEHIDEIRILIMDWKLGEKNPHDVILRFRELKPDLILIVVSGYQPQQKSIEKMNIFRWLTKPYDKNRLDLELQKALYLADRNK